MQYEPFPSPTTADHFSQLQTHKQQQQQQQLLQCQIVSECESDATICSETFPHPPNFCACVSDAVVVAVVVVAVVVVAGAVVGLRICLCCCRRRQIHSLFSPSHSLAAAVVVAVAAVVAVECGVRL